ncbi:MAG: exodeoxyribonuclease VII small subunit [Clostridia bacterium]|nr:exodeoxyribonuclease VII small subunit [Clostridia bacterium]
MENDEFFSEEINEEKADRKPTYEEAFAELEDLVAKMESSNLTLDESIKAYERGSALIRFCENELSRYDEVIKKLQGGQG